MAQSAWCVVVLLLVSVTPAIKSTSVNTSGKELTTGNQEESTTSSTFSTVSETTGTPLPDWLSVAITPSTTTNSAIMENTDGGNKSGFLPIEKLVVIGAAFLLMILTTLGVLMSVNMFKKARKLQKQLDDSFLKSHGGGTNTNDTIDERQDSLAAATPNEGEGSNRRHGELRGGIEMEAHDL